MPAVRHASRERIMKLEYDQQADAIYITLSDEAIASTREIDENIAIDVGADGKMVGIELLFVSDYLGPDDIDNFTVSTLRRSA